MSSSQFVTQRGRRILVTGLLVCVAVPGIARAHELPDLVADPPERPILEVDAGETGDERLLLRFDGHVHNDGAGPLEVTRSQGVVEQILRDPAALDADDPFDAARLLAPDSMKFENTDGHNHWHLQRIARYSLYDPTKTVPVAPVMKVGFCLLDSTHVDTANGVSAEYFSSCGRNQPNASYVRMGVSSGWRDLYQRELPFQYVDVSETQPGTYWLRSEIDPFELVEESDETNVPAETSYTVPGYLAMPGDAHATPPPSSLLLGSSPRGTGLGPVRFKIVTGPQHGTIDKPVGEWFTDPGVNYRTDDENTPERDRLVYVADDASSDYPRHPGRATVLFGYRPGPRVAMWGIPEKLRAGMTVDLEADGWIGDTPTGLTWSVTGGGAIDSGGRYTAPPTVPAGGKVTVTAMIAGGTESDSMEIEITPPPSPPQPAPRPSTDDTAQDVPVPVVPPPAGQPAQPAPQVPATPRPRKRTPIGSVRVRRVGPQLAIAVVPRASGRVRATLLRGTRKLGTCVVRVRARRSALCRLRFRRGATTIALTLVRRDGKVERRRVKVPGARA